MSWTDHTLPTGQEAQERIDLQSGRVTYDFCGTDATIDAIDILALAKVAELTMRRFTIPETATDLKSLRDGLAAARARLERLIELKDRALRGPVVPEADFWLHFGRVEGATTVLGCFGQSGGTIPADRPPDPVKTPYLEGEKSPIPPLPDRTGGISGGEP